MIDVPRETRHKLARLRELVIAENDLQNLISPATIGNFDVRHIADSLQLLEHITAGNLVDIGSGAGFPGLVLACARRDPVHLVEPRTRRADFLRRAVGALGLSNATVWCCRIERVSIAHVATITARAVASLPALFEMGAAISSRSTRWVLPKGRTVQSELDTALISWHGEFELVPSLTDPQSRIIVASGVHRRHQA